MQVQQDCSTDNTIQYWRIFVDRREQAKDGVFERNVREHIAVRLAEFHGQRPQSSAVDACRLGRLNSAHQRGGQGRWSTCFYFTTEFTRTVVPRQR